MTDRLQEIIDEFQAAPDAFRVEMLLERARAFPPLPERYRELRKKGLGRVHECMAEVYFFPEVEDGAVRIHADIPGEAPTQRALVGILMDAYDGASPEAVAAIPPDLLRQLGIGPLLGMQRQRGFS
ncbi:MAG: SufE family protein, partial [Bacteroidota bacterium]